MAHAYFDLDQQLPWHTISTRLNVPRSQLEHIFKMEFPGEQL